MEPSATDAKTGEYRESPPAPSAARPAAAAARRQTEGAPAPVIPDCCNIGVALRAFIVLNVAAAALAIVLAGAPAALWPRFLSIAMLLEPALLMSLGLLCIARRWSNGQAQRVQWIVGVGVPAAITALLAFWLAPFALGSPTPTQAAGWALTRGIGAAFVAAALLQHFRLRARAYAPSFSEARLQALQARIRPHFLFNSLNTVLGMIRSDPKRAEHTLENLADLFRVFMRDARELVPLDDEVLTCKQYLAIEQLRLSGRLKIAWDLDEMPGDALLPSLLLQPLLENAVHHGIEPRVDEGLLEIRISNPGDRVRVEIDNPVSATPPTRPGNQMALSNVRERLMLLYDMEAELKTAVEDGRFRLHLEFPYRKERRRRDVRRHIDPDR
ncbi:MAG: sensor histidine kinase [Lautropia sp.]